MKYSPLVVAFAMLTPFVVSAQNQQFSDCRTLALAGNFIGADEALVDGLVCKVGKPKTTAPASAQAAAKGTEGSEALLGIIEPETLRSREKARANRGVREATPGAAPGSLPRDSAPGGAAPSPSLVAHPTESLGEIARAFRKDAGLEVTGKPDKPDLDGKQPGGGEADRVTMVSQTDEAPTGPTVTERLPVPSEVSSLPEAAPAQAGKAATAPAAFSSTSREAPRATSEPIAVPEAPPSLLKSSSTSDLQAPSQAATPASAPRTATSERIAASPASGATLDAPKPERVATPEIFTAPRSTETESLAQPQADRLEDDSPFREGQASNCNKNVSLGSMDNDKLFLAIPEWALKWYAKNQKRFPRICFSDSLMPGAKNYLVVFYMVPPHAPAAESLAKVSSPGEAIGRSGMGSFTASYGSIWHYTYERRITTTIMSVSAEKAPHNQPSLFLDALAYSEQGIPVSHHARTPVAHRAKETSDKAGKALDVELPDFRTMEELLSQMMEDIAKQ